MARFNLQKGERFTLDKGADLERLRVDLQWANGIDLDAEAFLLGNDECIIDDADFVFYNSETRTPLMKEGQTEADFIANAKIAPFDRATFGSKKNWKHATAPISIDESVIGSYDDLGNDDDDAEMAGETMRVNLAKVRPEVNEIVFAVTVAPAEIEAGKSFKNVNKASVVITNLDNGEELCSYALNEKFSAETAVVVASLKLNDDGEWEFEAIGKGYDGGLQTLVDLYC